MIEKHYPVPTRLEQVMGVNHGRFVASRIHSGISEAEVRSSAAELIGAEHALLLAYRHKYEMAADLLDRAGHRLSDSVTAPDGSWWRDLFELTGEHMILTDEGWEQGTSKAEYLSAWKSDHPSWDNPILDEVNAPDANAQSGL